MKQRFNRFTLGLILPAVTLLTAIDGLRAETVVINQTTPAVQGSDGTGLNTSGVDSAGKVIKVALKNTFDQKSLTLADGQKADIVVHLKSGGEMLGGYRVYLVTTGDAKPVLFTTCDDFGVARFKSVPAGDYTVVLAKTAKQEKENSVSLGDLQLYVHSSTTSAEGHE